MIGDHTLSSMNVESRPRSSPPMDSNSLPLPSTEHGYGGLMKTRLDGAFPRCMCYGHVLHRTAKGCCSGAIVGQRSGMQLPGSAVGGLTAGPFAQLHFPLNTKGLDDIDRALPLGVQAIRARPFCFEMRHAVISRARTLWSGPPIARNYICI